MFQDISFIMLMLYICDEFELKELKESELKECVLQLHIHSNFYLRINFPQNNKTYY